MAHSKSIHRLTMEARAAVQAEAACATTAAPSKRKRSSPSQYQRPRKNQLGDSRVADVPRRVCREAILSDGRFVRAASS